VNPGNFRAWEFPVALAVYKVIAIEIFNVNYTAQSKELSEMLPTKHNGTIMELNAA